MDPSSSSRLQDPWEHTKTIFDNGQSSDSKRVRAVAIIHARQMAVLVEELDNLSTPGRTPSPREALIRCWHETVEALSVNRKSKELLSGSALDEAIEKLGVTRNEIAKVIQGLRDLDAPGVQFDPIAPHGPGSAQQKGKDIAGIDDNFLDFIQSKLGKRGPETIEEDQSQLPPLRTPGLPCKIPKIPGKY